LIHAVLRRRDLQRGERARGRPAGRRVGQRGDEQSCVTAVCDGADLQQLRRFVDANQQHVGFLQRGMESGPLVVQRTIDAAGDVDGRQMEGAGHDQTEEKRFEEFATPREKSVHG
jgi:hypothetical protein